MIGTTGKRIGAATAALTLTLGLTACGSGEQSGDGGDQTITMGIIPSWTDGLSTAYLWKNILEEDGYTVEIEEINDAAPLYTGLAEGDIDVAPMITGTVGLDGVGAAFGELASPDRHCKVLVTP